MEQALSEMSDGEISDGGLKIVIESPKRKSVKKRKTLNIDDSEKQMIESIEKELEKTLEEKATKTNLTVHNVKNILRQVATNEHVLALVRQTENPEAITEPPFEPKITRAKAKELYSTTAVASLPWLPSTKPSSEVQQLISEELAEDSSGDEYVPAEEESEDDPDSSSFLSESDIQSPATPCKPVESPKEINWTDDGIFKIPPPAKTKEEEEANIALRTRSKLSYSTTPLEILEEAFIPPDITTDMYDMDCDDDVYSDFLRKFTRPLDEITKGTEDEDHDPEYNILADEEIDEVDTEELRADKAVKITRKEVNDLMAELFEYANAFSEENEIDLPKIDLNVEQPQVNILEDGSLVSTEGESQNTTEINTTLYHNISTIEPACEKTDYSDIIQMDQKLLFEQQMRQHVQMLTQHFLLTYEHPEFHDSAIKFKENLVNFQLLSNNKKDSAFKTCNLGPALKLIEEWEKQFALNTDEVRMAKQHVCKVISESIQSRAAGIEYILTFPTLFLETVSKSEVFLYPSLLPRIPFKTASLLHSGGFIRSEDELIALGMEQFIPYLAQDSFHLTYKGQVKLTSVSKLIGQYMMPSKDVKRLYCHIFNSKHPNKEMNPIKYYFQNNKAPVTMHYVVSLKEFGAVPPIKRNKELLPYQWRKYLYPNEIINNSTITSQVPSSFTKVPKPPAFNKNFTNKSPPKRRLAPKAPVNSTPPRNSNAFRNRNRLSLSPIAKELFSSTPKVRPTTQVTKTKKLETYFKSTAGLKFNDNISSCVRCMKFNSSIFESLRKEKKVEESSSSFDNMLPSMPFLGASSRDTDLSETFTTLNTSKDCNDGSTGNNNNNKTVEADSTILEIDEEEINEKDSEEDALAALHSSIKNRKSLSRGEKKKEKLRKEYTATLSMLTPEDPTVIQEKAQSYAQAYFDKARERLDSQDYNQFMEILNSFSERTNNVSDLYKQMEMILGQKHQDLMDEFLTFLTPAQAKDVGKLIPYYMLSNMSLFLRKLEIYFKEQPAQLRKIYRSLTDLSTCMNVTMERVKNTILPLLKGNNLLTDWFLQIFPCEPPPASLLKGQWEHVDVRREFNSNDDVFETVTIPEADDPYGGPNCICSCHQGDDLMFKSRSQHCFRCGIKFLQGRVYIQTGKGLRLANVTFNDSPDVDHNNRLSCSSADKKKRRSENSPAKQITSPIKDNQEEVRVGNDSEDDTAECSKRKSRITRSPRKKKIKLSEKSDNKQIINEEQCDKIVPIIPDSINNDEPKNIEEEEEPMQQDIAAIIPPPIEEDCTDLDKPIQEEINNEWDCNASIESIELRQSPEHSAESESEFCEESSQDNINTETDDSAEELESLSNSPVHSENSNNSNTCEEIWTRDEDKIILETLQKEGDKEDAFVQISEVLGNRTVPQIKERFDTLINLLQKMASCSSSTF